MQLGQCVLAGVLALGGAGSAAAQEYLDPSALLPDASAFGPGWIAADAVTPLSDETGGADSRFYGGPQGSRAYVAIATFDPTLVSADEVWAVADVITDRLVGTAVEKRDVEPSEVGANSRCDRSRRVAAQDPAFGDLYTAGMTICLDAEGVMVATFVSGELMGYAGVEGSEVLLDQVVVRYPPEFLDVADQGVSAKGVGRA